LFDTHCHFNLEAFQDDLGIVIRAARKQGVDRFLVPGVDLASCQRGISIGKKYPGSVFAAVGIHPNYSGEAEANAIECLVVDHPDQVIAVGEIGLDYYRTYTTKHAQIKMLENMLSLASTHHLPICLHNRDAEGDLLEILSQRYSSQQHLPGQTGVFHAYDGSQAVADWGMEHGFYFGIGGLVTYQKSDALRHLIKEIGLKRLVLETDAPYLTPNPHRGQRNTPANLVFIVDAVASCIGTCTEEVIEVTDQNAAALFGFK
jgi:TatD DNase family protein